MSEPVRRKGAVRRADVEPAVLAALNAGTLETASLPEFLVLDMAALLRATLPHLPAAAFASADAARELGVVRRMERCGSLLVEHVDPSEWDALARHPSDTVRGWVCYAVGLAPKFAFEKRLARMKPLADDPHFGVREWAWLPMRPHVAENVERAVNRLLPWAKAKSANVRRFAIEVTRPRGVWTNHLAALKESPELGLPLLEACRADASRYVQDSVANWLNDAGKSRPDWVREVVADWLADDPSPATQRIARRALRNLTA